MNEFLSRIEKTLGDDANEKNYQKAKKEVKQYKEKRKLNYEKLKEKADKYKEENDKYNQRDLLKYIKKTLFDKSKEKNIKK